MEPHRPSPITEYWHTCYAEHWRTREALANRVRAMVHEGDKVDVVLCGGTCEWLIQISNGGSYGTVRIEPQMTMLPDDQLYKLYIAPLLNEITEHILLTCAGVIKPVKIRTKTSNTNTDRLTRDMKLTPRYLPHGETF